ncbi:MAG: hypothetical protein Q8P18_15450 [Pseudomonadota bacterium]|nr:hypothetical protein [Pseudomonadota bacterium]
MTVDAAVSILIDDMLDPLGKGLDPVFLAGATQDMKGRVRGMPKYMGAGMTALTVLFVASGYTLLPKARRVARIERWRRSPVSLQRDFVEFWEKMSTFTYFSRVEQAAHAAP